MIAHEIAAELMKHPNAKVDLRFVLGPELKRVRLKLPEWSEYPEGWTFWVGEKEAIKERYEPPTCSPGPGIDV